MWHSSVNEFKPIEPNSTYLFRAPDMPEEEVSRVRELLSFVHQLTGWDDIPLMTTPLDSYSAEAILISARDAVTKFVNERALTDNYDEATARASALLCQLGQARAFLRDAMLSKQTTALRNVQRALNRMRHGVDSVSKLLEIATVENTNLGFRRSLISRVENSCWVPRFADIPFDRSLEHETIEAGSQKPRKLNSNLLESEMVRRRVPILVMNAQSHTKTHPELMQTTGTLSYVGAPIVSGSTVIGFIHADCFGERDVDAFDRDLIRLFAEGLGLAVERTVFYERLKAIGQKFNEHSNELSDFIASFMDESVQMIPTTEDHSQAESTVGPWRVTSDETSVLTRREREILRHMAAGATNTFIANRLVISVGTVKSHVKNILRKLNAANRAEAVYRFLASEQGNSWNSASPLRS